MSVTEPPFGMHHLTVVPANFEPEASDTGVDEEVDEADEVDEGTDTAVETDQ